MSNEINYALLLENFFSNPSFFGGIVKYWRDEKGWSRKKLADEVNMHPSNIQRYEEGKIANIPFSVVSTFAKAFNVSIETFLGKEVTDKVSQTFFEDFIKENDRKKERIGDLRVIENTLKKLGVSYAPNTNEILDEIQEGVLNPEMTLLGGPFTIKTDLEILVFIILLLCPKKDPFIGRLITFDETNDFHGGIVEKRAEEYARVIWDQLSNFWLLVKSFRSPSYNNNTTSRKRFLTTIKSFLRFLRIGRLSQQECKEILDGINLAYSLMDPGSVVINLDYTIKED
nr:MAG TPA: helix-turn-helix domain protein [Caudoviricetes sp.]